jgi:uncharacterized protein (TIGR03435 family)
MERLFFECAIRAALLVAGVAVLLQVLRVKNAAAQHRIWTGVILAMLLLPLWTLWGPKAALRVLPPVAERALVPAMLPQAGDLSAQLLQLGTNMAETTASVAAPSRLNRHTILLSIYLLGLCALLLRLAFGTVRARRLMRRSVVRDGRLTSSSCAAPVTTGWFRAKVILPEEWPGWPQAKLDAVLIHEGEHARRRDPLAQGLALVNRAVFWFHPAAWWLERHLSSLAEEACDDVVLARGHDPGNYSEYLMDMARAVMNSGARISVAGLAMPGSSLPRRIKRIIDGVPAPPISRARMACVAAACLITGTLFAAASLGHVRLSTSAQPESNQTEFSDETIRQASSMQSLPGAQTRQVVEAIVFDGNRRIRSDELKSRIFTRPGDAYNNDILKRDLVALSNSQFFDNVRLEVRDTPGRAGAQIVVFHLVERPIINQIDYRGFQAVALPDISRRLNERHLEIAAGNLLDPAKVRKIEGALQELLAERAHSPAAIRATIEVIPGTNAVRLIFTVDDGSSVAVPPPSPESQSPPASARPLFDSTSIKTSNSRAFGFFVRRPAGQAFTSTANGVTLRQLIIAAYPLTLAQTRLIAGAPNWMDSERFDIEFRTQDNPAEARMRSMLGSLLTDRFKLVTRSETQILPVYALELSATGELGPALRQHIEGTDSSVSQSRVNALKSQATASPFNTIMGRPVTMDMLAAYISGLVDRPVVDRTGLTGSFDFQLDHQNGPTGLERPDPGKSQPVTDMSAVFATVQDQLGLKLVPTNGPVDVLVIDHVEMPTEGTF